MIVAIGAIGMDRFEQEELRFAKEKLSVELRTEKID